MKGSKVASSVVSECNSSRNKAAYSRECKRRKMEETNSETGGNAWDFDSWSNSSFFVANKSLDDKVCDGVEFLKNVDYVDMVPLEHSFEIDHDNNNGNILRENRKQNQNSKSIPDLKENTSKSPIHDNRSKGTFLADGFAIHRRKKPRPNGKDAFEVLSDEMVIQIFRWLPKAFLRHCAQVSRRWNRLSSDESLWSRIDLGGSGRTLRPNALSQVLSRGTRVLRLASAEIPDPVFAPESKFITDNALCKVQYLDLSMSIISEEGVSELLGTCQQLRKLSLEQCKLGNRSCIAIGRNENLEVLNLCSCTGITEVGIKRVLKGCQRLQSLNLAWTGLSLASLNVLCDNLPSVLQRINLSGCREELVDSHVERLVRHCPELVELDLSDCAQLSGTAVNAVVEGLSKIEYLALSRCYNIPSSAYLSLAAAESLMYLDVFGLMSEQSLASLQSSLSEVEINKFFFSSVARPTVGIRRTSIWGLRVRD